MALRPHDIAERLHISTTTLRAYEDWGMVPRVGRTAKGYRVYTDEHAAYFICIREMLPGFSVTCIARILKEVMAGRIDEALWIAGKSLSELQGEKRVSEKIASILQKETEQSENGGGKLTVRELSDRTGVPATTIRFWDKAGLISSCRCCENNYRLFTEEQVRQVLTIAALKLSLREGTRKTSIGRIREEMQAFEGCGCERIAAMADGIERCLYDVNRAKLSGLSALLHLCSQAEANCFDKFIV
jgi:DNA-binding transcriptional MerR regulator